ncbi:MAG: hypothetical protein ACD_58C00167G0005 [uncultured bacterium]|nr:MAG: hypothetical protein ACD_58C00167G0005 [uncultured bacterium]
MCLKIEYFNKEIVDLVESVIKKCMQTLANFVAIFHGLVMIGLLGGPMFLFSKKRYPKLENIFIVLGGLTALSFIITGACFLTTLEKNIRVQANLPSYSSGFVRHYLGEVGINVPDIATTITLAILITIGLIRIIWLKYKK